jgi:hypothetical protein
MDFKEKTRRYFDLYSSKDLETLSNMFDEKVRFQDGDIIVTGKSAVIEAIKNVFDNVTSVSVIPIHIYQEHRNVFAELDVLVNDEQRMSAVHVITYTGDKLINSIRSYKG